MSSQPAKRNIIKRVFGSTLSVLGILAGAASIISLVQSWTGIGVAATVAENALMSYRAITQNIKFALFDWWPPLFDWNIWMPLWGMDLLAIYVLSLAGLERDQSTRKILEGTVTLDYFDDPSPKHRISPKFRDYRWLIIRYLFPPLVIVREIWIYAKASAIWTIGIFYATIAQWFQLKPASQVQIGWTDSPEEMFSSLQFCLSSLTKLSGAIFLTACFFAWNGIQLSS